MTNTQNALVTGSSNPDGLGFAVATKLRSLGYDVYDIPFESLAHKEGIEAHLFTLPKIDVVINNFGINHLSWIGETPDEDQDILYYNILVPYWIINALVARGDICRVINVASITHRVAQRCTSLYCASKAALVHMTRVMARELAPKGWVINSISPGKIEETTMTEMTDKQINELRGWTQEEADSYATSLIPMGRFTNKSEVSAAIIQLLYMPNYINGTNLDITGAI